MLDNQVSATFVVNCPSKRRFQLLSDIEVVKDGYSACILLDDPLLVWSNQTDIVFYLLEDVRIIDIDTIIGWIK